MFRFFSRKPHPLAAFPESEKDAAENVATDALAEAGSSTAGGIVPHFEFPPKQQQLHTPSPSIDGVSAVVAAEPLPTKPKAKPRAKPKPKPKHKEVSPAISEIPPGPVDTPSPVPEEVIVTDPTALHALIASVPAQTLHSYTLARLNPALFSSTGTLFAEVTPPTLTALTAFFSSLTPPPKLHCVRCHSGYFDLENNDTACRVQHDDDSALVERVGLGKGMGTEYETLWGCCARTVEGDGDMGPPDGWCYEGAHTTDTKRARFRADSTPQDDKLASCARLRCGMPPLPARSSLGRASRKRNRRLMEDSDEDDEDVQSLASSHTRSQSMASVKGKAKDATGEDTNAETKLRPVKRPRSRKQSTSMLPPATKENRDEDAMDVDAPQQPSPPKSPRRKAAVTTSAKAKPPSSGGKAAQLSPLSTSFIPAAATNARDDSPTRKPRSQVEVQIISRSPPKGTLSAQGSASNLKGLKAKGSVSSLRAKAKSRALGEIVDTSVDGEGTWN